MRLALLFLLAAIAQADSITWGTAQNDSNAVLSLSGDSITLSGSAVDSNGDFAGVLYVPFTIAASGTFLLDSVFDATAGGDDAFGCAGCYEENLVVNSFAEVASASAVFAQLPFSTSQSAPVPTTLTYQNEETDLFTLAPGSYMLVDNLSVLGDDANGAAQSEMSFSFTSTLTDPSFTTPEPSALIFTALGLVAMALWKLRSHPQA